MAHSDGSSRHSAFRVLPSVSVAGLRAPLLADRQRAAKALLLATREAGFLYVTGHGVTDERRDRLIDVARRYFAQPEERKREHYIGLSRAHRGYVPEGEELRLIHYPPGTSDDSVGIAAHTDYELFTILLATSPGLEVVNGAGDWIDAPPLPGAFVVNIGDMLEILTNGELVATSHRVRRVSEERYSFPLFFCCDYHTVVAPLPAFVDQGRPVAYRSLIAGEHLYAQTAQTFAYLKKRLARGEITLPDNAQPLGSFARADPAPAERAGQ